MFEDPLFWLCVAPGLLLGSYAQSKIKSNYVRYSQIPTESGLTGAQVARYLLDSQGLQSVAVEQTPGLLSDHYDPRHNILRLSPEVYNTPSLAAVGIAAHETGHALQDAAGYFPMQIRAFIVPLVQLSARFAPWLFFGGIILNMPPAAWVGVIMFGASTLFSLVTLPVEIDASNRAKALLESQNVVRGEDQKTGIAKVLNSAAWTYVAGAVSAIGTLLYVALVTLTRVRRGP
jgi:Zn-dependent membrane protease YugP